jgi:octaprenyl-diphosphate synthase
LRSVLEIPDISAHLELLDKTLQSVFDTSTPSIRKPALRMVRSGGKRLRPTLLMAAAVSQGGEIDDKVITMAAAIELAHLGSLVHDDSIDNAKTRHSIPTINSTEGVHVAIVVGDYFLAKACERASAVGKEFASVVADAITAMCNGQAHELADCYNADRSIEAYLASVHGKTAALMSAACRAGALCAGLSDAHVAALARYGTAFGMAFQLIDDVLDFLAAPESMGKSAGNDLRAGVYTMPLLLALRGPSRSDILPLLGRKPISAKERKRLVDTLLGSGAFEVTVEKARKFIKDAAEDLRGFHSRKTAESLTKFSELYIAQSLQKQIASLELYT